MEVTDPIIIHRNFDINILYQNVSDNEGLRIIMAECVEHPILEVLSDGTNCICMTSASTLSGIIKGSFMKQFHETLIMFGQEYEDKRNFLNTITNIIDNQKEYKYNVPYELLVISKTGKDSYQAYCVYINKTRISKWFGIKHEDRTEIKHRFIRHMYIINR